MNTKSIVISVVVVIVILLGGYFILKGTSQPAAPAQNNQTASSTTLVQGQDVKVGTGTAAAPGDTVSVLYVGKLADGTVFDSSAAHGNQPLSFTLGSQSLIAGFQIGVNGMKVGGERLLAVPPSLGYGSQDVKDPVSGKVIIPANSTLVFDVQLVSVKPGTTTPATQ
jgi:FKBP-type peptidyl-prolyl cis-trans isomerase